MAILEATLTGSGFINLANPGFPEMLIVLAIVLIVFGPKRLPALARSVGKSITDFKKGLNDDKGEIERAGDEIEAAEKKTAAEEKEKTA